MALTDGVSVLPVAERTRFIDYWNTKGSPSLEAVGYPPSVYSVVAYESMRSRSTWVVEVLAGDIRAHIQGIMSATEYGAYVGSFSLDPAFGIQLQEMRRVRDALASSLWALYPDDLVMTATVPPRSALVHEYCRAHFVEVYALDDGYTLYSATAGHLKSS